MASCPMCNADVDDENGAMDKHHEETHPEAASKPSESAPATQE